MIELMEMPKQLIRLFVDSTTLGHLATSHQSVPHVTPVWLDYDHASGNILIDVEAKTVKLRNVRLNPNVCLSLVAPNEPSMWAVIHGTISQVDAAGDDTSHVQTLAMRYLGRPKKNPGQRFILHMKPTRIRWWGDEK